MSQLEGIEYFVRTVEAGSFAAAARRLGVTPSAVSRAAGGRARRPAARPHHAIHALYPKNRHLVPKVGAFLDFLGEVFGGARSRRRPTRSGDRGG